MANKVGAPLGNKNATKNKPITEELTKVLHEECEHNGEKTIKLRKLVSVWVDSALDGDRNATKEIVNRIEGTPVQSRGPRSRILGSPLRGTSLTTGNGEKYGATWPR